METTRHLRNFVVLWLLSNVIMLPIVIWLLGPGLPPGNGSVQASGQVVDNIVLLATATPVATGVLVYLGYALWAFRERTPEVVVDGPAVRGHAGLQFWWLIVTTILVLFLAGYGTVRLLADGSGGGQGPNPIAALVDEMSDEVALHGRQRHQQGRAGQHHGQDDHAALCPKLSRGQLEQHRESHHQNRAGAGRGDRMGGAPQECRGTAGRQHAGRRACGG